MTAKTSLISGIDRNKKFEKLAQYFRSNLRKGELLTKLVVNKSFSDDLRPNHFYFVDNGLVRIERKVEGENGRKIFIDDVKQNQFFGELEVSYPLGKESATIKYKKASKVEKTTGTAKGIVSNLSVDTRIYEFPAEHILNPRNPEAFFHACAILEVVKWRYETLKALFEIEAVKDNKKTRSGRFAALLMLYFSGRLPCVYGGGQAMIKPDGPIRNFLITRQELAFRLGLPTGNRLFKEYTDNEPIEVISESITDFSKLFTDEEAYSYGILMDSRTKNLFKTSLKKLQEFKTKGTKSGFPIDFILETNVNEEIAKSIYKKIADKKCSEGELLQRFKLNYELLSRSDYWQSLRENLSHKKGQAVYCYEIVLFDPGKLAERAQTVTSIDWPSLLG